jgi:hypothetical protein
MIFRFIILDVTNQPCLCQEFALNYSILDCLLGLFYEHGLFFPKLMISIASYQPFVFQVPTGHDLVSAGLEQTVEAVLRVLIDFYANDVSFYSFVRCF